MKTSALLSPLPLESPFKKGEFVAMPAFKPLPALRFTDTALPITNLPMARSLNQLFDRDWMPSEKVFGNLSTQDVTVRFMVVVLTIPQVIMAFANHRHPFETLGGQTMEWFSSLGITMFTKNDKFSVNSWLLDAAMRDKDQVKPASKGFILGKLWHNWVQNPIQKKYGLPGNLETEVLRPGLIKGGKWPSFSQNEVDSLRCALKQTELVFVPQHLNRALTDLFSPENTLPVNELADRLCKHLKTTSAHGLPVGFGNLLNELDPLPCLKQELENFAARRFNFQPDKYPHPQLSAEQIQTEAERFARLFRLYKAAPSAQDSKKLEQLYHTIFNEALLQAPAAQRDFSKDKLVDFLKEVSTQWRTKAEAAIDHSAQLCRKAFYNAVEFKEHGQSQEQILGNLTKQLVDLGSEPKTGLPKLKGMLGHALRDVFFLEERMHLTDAFLKKRALFLLLQTVFLASINCVLIGRMITLFTFHTFARLDPDFNPAELDKLLHKPKRIKALNPQEIPRKPGELAPKKEGAVNWVPAEQHSLAASRGVGFSSSQARGFNPLLLAPQSVAGGRYDQG